MERYDTSSVHRTNHRDVLWKGRTCPLFTELITGTSCGKVEHVTGTSCGKVEHVLCKMANHREVLGHVELILVLH